MIDRDAAHRFAEDWIAAWNSRDLDRVLAHYAEDFDFSSPLIVQVVGKTDGRLQGKAAVRGYWERCLQAVPALRLDLKDVLVGMDTLTLYYHGPRGMAAETLQFDAAGKVYRAAACYA